MFPGLTWLHNADEGMNTEGNTKHALYTVQCTYIFFWSTGLKQDE